MFDSTPRRMSSRVISAKALNGGPPLLLTRMSASGQAAISAARVAGSSRSPATSRTVRPVDSRMSFAADASRPRSRPLTTSSQPASASASAQARPKPLLEAQTTALRPAIPRSILNSPHLDSSQAPTYNANCGAASSKRHENLRTDCTREQCERTGVSKLYGTHRYRTLFLSDLHLGTRGCQAYLILDMLRHVEADTIYLIGDIIDGWRLRAGWYWPQAHNDVVQKLLRKVRRGARMVFVPGNHDEFARQFFGLTFGGIEIKRQAIHAAADGKRYLIIHGDEFDVVVRHSKWLAYFGDWAYVSALFVNTYFNAARRALGLPYWSFSAWAKLKVKNAVSFIGSFERELAGEEAPGGRR